ncbi:MAG: hypothetical protein AAB152_12845 [Candidatus Coatesbacteria bacterium]
MNEEKSSSGCGCGSGECCGGGKARGGPAQWMRFIAFAIIVAAAALLVVKGLARP